DHRPTRTEREARLPGVCKSPWKGRGYRINCNVSGHTLYPITYHMRVTPLYRNPDGTWPYVPEGHKAGDLYVATRDGKNVQWRRLYRPLELRSEDEALVFLVAHEAFHYLRRTRQVAGRHGEINPMPSPWRRWSSTAMLLQCRNTIGSPSWVS
ncbi:MAG: hypothetical protein LC751_20490, partial [Actinobacteria bacterium]|nr:hypothetical protein [Actinomycetota bacterium]